MEMTVAESRTSSPDKDAIPAFRPAAMQNPAQTELFSGDSGDRQGLETRWLDLTRRRLPSLAASRRWPVRLDHCFQRILLDNAAGGRWTDHVIGRPAYRCADTALLRRAVALGVACIADTEDLAMLNRRSLAWRGVRTAG